ncbi:MAG TPA: cysteine--tRNA ligase [Candidatus Portnoybacteria bacterium]|nr:cysteine--tRNA ligase [Candidatus Portnoybacteria bacterium]
MKVYNTLTRKKENFRPIKKGRVGMYVCGPTVYDYAHIGNFRSYLVADFIRGWLEYSGYRVKQVKNITDVGHLTEEELEDKMIVAARREKKGPQEIARFYTRAFLEDEKKLRIKTAHQFPKATKHIPEMIKLIKILLKKGYAYQIEDGIYYQISQFKNYGKLSGNTLNQLAVGVRIEPNPNKKHPADFALWKKAKLNHLMQWVSPWGKGYPGWHIECSAMSMKYLGPSFDIHTGGEDNIFPHHEDEIAQSEAATGQKFVNYWIHVRHLLVNGQKMAKSKKNFYTLRDLEKKGYQPLAFRLLVMGAHHRSGLNFTLRGLKQAQESLERIWEFIDKLKRSQRQRQGPPKKSLAASKLIKKTKIRFEKYMNDDFNTPRALAVIFDLIKEGNKLIDQNKLGPAEAKAMANLLMKFDQVLGIFKVPQPVRIPTEIKKLVKTRQQARQAKDWSKADRIRQLIRKKGYQVEDTSRGPKTKQPF